MIWIVTSEESTRTPLVALIRRKGYAVAEIECGDDVHTRLQFRIPQLIIIDCGMPDSFATLKKFKADPRSMRIPAIMFTTDDHDCRDQSLLMGADGYVPKGSLDWHELLQEIVRLIGPATDNSDAQ